MCFPLWGGVRFQLSVVWCVTLGESCLGNMVRKRAAGREPQGREPCGRKAKGESMAGRVEKEAGESEI